LGASDLGASGFVSAGALAGFSFGSAAFAFTFGPDFIVLIIFPDAHR
jgi:hypothetical protein